MIRWAIRLIVVVAGPTIGWFEIAQTPRGIFVGVLYSLMIIAAEIIIDRIPLDNIVAGAMGTVIGLITGKLLDYAVYLLDKPMLYDRVHKYSLLINILLAYLGMVVALVFLGRLHKKGIMFYLLLLLCLSPAFMSKLVSERISYTFQTDQKQS